MPTDEPPRLLAPVTAAAAHVTSDAAVVDALVSAEVALTRAAAALGLIDADAATEVSREFGWDAATRRCSDHGIDVAHLAAASPASGSPVLPLVEHMRSRVTDAAVVHVGSTSQDVLDTALMLVASDAARAAATSLDTMADTLAAFALAHRDTLAMGRTLTQDALPVTVGLRAAHWRAAVVRAAGRLRAAVVNAPVQVGGAVGTLEGAIDLARSAGVAEPHEAAARLPAAVAAQLGLAVPTAPWHTVRWPVTEIADAMVQAVDAVGVFAADVALLTRSGAAELVVAADGRSTAMPHKRNPTAAVLIRSAALRAPHLGATLHTASAAATDERPDGAWHAEWAPLQDLSALAAGAAELGAQLAASLDVDRAAIDAALARSATGTDAGLAGRLVDSLLALDGSHEPATS